MRDFVSTRRRRPAGCGAAAVLLALALTGCASIPQEIREVSLSAPLRIELRDTPFFPQERYQCGPAALATLLTSSGVPSDPGALIGQVYVPAREGSLQAEMLAATRRAERIPYLIDGNLSALLRELEAGRPVLVLQNLGVSWLPRWHYAVVVGIDVADDRVILRSGLDERRVTATDVFLRTWRRSDYWGFVALKPGRLPASPDADRYFRSVAAMEATGHTDAATDGWEAGVEGWPDDPVALFGLATARLTGGDAAAAEELYRRVSSIDPGNLMARNNLAYALAALGRRDEAIDVLESALVAAAGDARAAAIIEDSLDELSRRSN